MSKREPRAEPIKKWPGSSTLGLTPTWLKLFCDAVYRIKMIVHISFIRFFGKDKL